PQQRGLSRGRGAEEDGDRRAVERNAKGCVQGESRGPPLDAFADQLIAHTRRTSGRGAGARRSTRARQRRRSAEIAKSQWRRNSSTPAPGRKWKWKQYG